MTKNITPVDTHMTLSEYAHSLSQAATETIDLEEEIEELQEDYNDISQDTLEESFEVLKENIATNKIEALNENYTNIKEKYEQYWTDNRLRFIKNDNGTYLIEQQDENGNWIGMGYTTEEIVLEYLRKIKSLEDTPQEEPKQEEQSQPEIKKEPEKIFYEDLSEEVKKEILKYDGKCFASTDHGYKNYEKRHSHYDELSDEAKKIIDGRINGDIDFKYEKTVKDFVERKESITISETNGIKIPGFRDLVPGETLEYNQDTGKYYLNGDEKLAFEVSDIENAEFIPAESIQF